MDGIYEQYFETVYGYLYTLTGGNPDAAEELTQETFYRATKKISEFRGDSKLSTWLCQIAKFSYYQSIDKKKRLKEVPLDDTFEAVSPSSTENKIEEAEAKVNVYKAISALGSPMKDVVLLRLTGDLSFKEIGDILNKSENWARVNFYRAKQILGKELEHNE
ncbi:MAG: sigma-70 family RNA polymerase sigma factor [Lachnospiraceae bacterium]|nr:sigma-70 family RNA polymerase sigma factor [Lachnospiraceae bacterium]MBO7600695.1 sigma-70 family RNA polymerase sigma factor [Lachnospiraceae bacterium]